VRVELVGMWCFLPLFGGQGGDEHEWLIGLFDCIDVCSLAL
jgi:hypothetical protein